MGSCPNPHPKTAFFKKKNRPLSRSPAPYRPRVLLTPHPSRTSENLTEKANDLSKILSNIQYTLQSRKLKASVHRSKFHCLFSGAILKQEVILVKDYDKYSCAEHHNTQVEDQQ